MIAAVALCSAQWYALRNRLEYPKTVQTSSMGAQTWDLCHRDVWINATLHDLMRLCSLGIRRGGSQLVPEPDDQWVSDAVHRDGHRKTCLTRRWKTDNISCSATCRNVEMRKRYRHLSHFSILQSLRIKYGVLGRCRCRLDRLTEVEHCRRDCAPVVIACAAVLQTFELHTFVPTSLLHPLIAPGKSITTERAARHVVVTHLEVRLVLPWIPQKRPADIGACQG
jgi:hypothetical protein